MDRIASFMRASCCNPADIKHHKVRVPQMMDFLWRCAGLLSAYFVVNGMCCLLSLTLLEGSKPKPVLGIVTAVRRRAAEHPPADAHAPHVQLVPHLLPAARAGAPGCGSASGGAHVALHRPPQGQPLHLLCLPFSL